MKLQLISRQKILVFFNKLGIDVLQLEGFEIDIQPVEKESATNTEEDISIWNY